MAVATLSDDTQYCKLVLLLQKGGTFGCKKIVLNCADSDSITVDACLDGNKRVLENARKRKQITGTQWHILFPANATPTDLDKWDISLLTYILLNLFNDKLTAREDNAIRCLRDKRNTIFHSTLTYMSERPFMDDWYDLSKVLSKLTERLSLEDRREIEDIENNIYGIQYFNVAMDEIKSIESFGEFEENMLEMINSHKKYQDETNKHVDKLEGGYKNLAIILKAIIIAKAQNKEAADAAQASLFRGAQQCVSGEQEKSSDDVDQVSDAIKKLFSDIRDNDVNIDSVEEGSVIFIIRCNSITALKAICKYFEEKRYKEKLTELEDILSERLLCSVKLNFSIVLETLCTALTEIENSNRSKSVVLTLHCKDAEGARNAYNCLVNGSSTNAVNKVSEALSESVGQKIELHTTIDKDKLERDISNLTKPQPLEDQSALPLSRNETDKMTSCEPHCTAQHIDGVCPNWVKAVTALEIAKNAAFPHIENRMKKFVEKLKSLHACHFEDLMYRITVDENSIVKKYKNRKEYEWVLCETECTQCKKMFECIRDEYNEDQCLCKMKWKCHDLKRTITDDTYWWILSKIYITDGCYVNTSTGPEDVDPLAVFSLMTRCKQFTDNKVHATMLIDRRHELMHSKDNTLSEEGMEATFNLVEYFFEERPLTKFLSELEHDLEKLRNEQYFGFDINSEWQVIVREALQLQKTCLKTDFQIPPDSTFDLITPRERMELENDLKRTIEQSYKEQELENDMKRIKESNKQQIYDAEIRREYQRSKRELENILKHIEQSYKQQELENILKHIEQSYKQQKMEKDKKINEKIGIAASTTSGATVGTLVGGPVGTVVGGAIGAAVGGMYYFVRR